MYLLILKKIEIKVKIKMLKNNHINQKTLLLKWFDKCTYVHYRKLLTEQINFINNLSTLHGKINHKNLHT